jgi:dimethylhistidine N-methyltransferase
MENLDNFSFLDAKPIQNSFADKIIEGLKKKNKNLPSSLFYDEKGIGFFNKITSTTAYYPTRTEINIYQNQSKLIANELKQDSVLVEFGPGDMSKIRYLLKDIKPKKYVGIDISQEEVKNEGTKLANEFPWVHVTSICDNFYNENHITVELLNSIQEPKIGFFPGSTIGNIEPADAKTLLIKLKNLLGSKSKFIVGVDLLKPVKIIENAYNDPEKYTEQFNLNILKRINKDFNANFNTDMFEHYAFFNDRSSRVEMHLKSKKAHNVIVSNTQIEFKKGETIHTENSYKYSEEKFIDVCEAANLNCSMVFKDQKNWFGVFLLEG